MKRTPDRASRPIGRPGRAAEPEEIGRSNTSGIGSNLQIQAGGDELVSFASVLGFPNNGVDCVIDAGSVTTSLGYNFSSDATCGFGGGAGDIVSGGDPFLVLPLSDNGGPTATLLPQPGSPLIDRVNCAAAPEPVTADQRGVSRPQGPACDIGAVEVEVVVPIPVPPSFTG